MTTDSAEILAVPSEALSGFYDHTEFRSEPARVNDAVNIVRKHGQFYPREWAEQTESVRQVIPCVIVRNGPKLLCVKRAKKGRDDLRLRYTLLFGGHVDAEDSNGDRERILHRCAERELHEELGLCATVSPESNRRCGGPRDRVKPAPLRRRLRMQDQRPCRQRPKRLRQLRIHAQPPTTTTIRSWSRAN